MSNRRVSKEELEAFWRGDKNTYQRMYSDRMQQKANEAERLGKKVTYVPNDGTQNLPEVNIMASRETEELKQAKLKLDYENFTNNAITAAGFIPGLDIAADIADISNSWRKGDKAGVLWGITGLGLPVSGKIVRATFNKLKNPLKTFYTDLYPHFYKIQNNLNFGGLKDDVKAFLRADITENPFKAVGRNRLYKRRWYHPKSNVEDVTLDPSIIVNSLEDALGLTKTRWLNGGQDQISSNRGSWTLSTPQEDWDSIDILNYMPLSKIWKRTEGMPMFKRPFVTILKYHEANTVPGLALPSDLTILINDKIMSLDKGRSDVALGHEIDHILNKIFLYSPKGFDYSHLPKRYRTYLSDGTEISARGNQLKNYFGFTSPDLIITPDMLKYAARHYVGDTGIDNNMLLFFSGIKDWDAAAAWLSKYSLKKGGKL